MIQLPESDQAPSLMPDMTALLDVIFILLVFMMLTANVAPQLLDVDLPQAEAPADTVSPDAITVGINSEGLFSVNRKVYADWPEFQQALKYEIHALKAKGETPQLLVAADKNVALQPFVKLAAWLSEQELSVAQIVVDEE